MRFYLGGLCLGVLAAMLGLVMFTTSNAHADVPRTFDGNGVLVGSWIAPVQLEIFCEPQCPDCKAFEAAAGDRLATALNSGRLAITYRWLTFLDGRHHNDVSARLVNALFLAADPATSPTAYQAFVQDLYHHQSSDGPSNEAVATMARESGLPDVVADRIAAADNVVDSTAIGDTNKARLKEENPANPGTPTIYNLNTRSVVDTQDPGWLDALTN
jgi:protein-disulfide isomerase